MTKHFNIGEAKTKLSQLIAAARRGEDVVIDHNGKPQVRLVLVEEASAAERERIAAKRRTFIGKWAKAFEGYDTSPEALKSGREYSEARRRMYGDDLR
ncbi:MAG: type II toxin-antitoxin system prevent-host-death family antitoxin [Sphingomicrobium sp.]